MSYFVEPYTGSIWPLKEGKLNDENKWEGESPFTEIFGGTRIVEIKYRADGTAAVVIEDENCELTEYEVYDTLQEYLDEL
ncbi:hypothetical protein [Serratia phage SP1]|nr:hypothetical protein [Serratia phage SP1]